MLIKQNKQLLRNANYGNDSKIESVQMWQYKTFYDASNYGLDLIWQKDDCTNKDFKKVGKIFSVVLDDFIKTPEGHNLMILPKYGASAEALVQMIETDWWVGNLEILFKYKKCEFKKDKPFAQAIAVPRRDYVLQQDNGEILAREFLYNNADEFITRKKFGIDNLYERMINLQRSDSLPDEICKKDKLKLRLGLRNAT